MKYPPSLKTFPKSAVWSGEGLFLLCWTAVPQGNVAHCQTCAANEGGVGHRYSAGLVSATHPKENHDFRQLWGTGCSDAPPRGQPQPCTAPESTTSALEFLPNKQIICFSWQLKHLNLILKFGVRDMKPHVSLSIFNHVGCFWGIISHVFIMPCLKVAIQALFWL